MTDTTYPLFPVFAFLGFVLPLVPLPWHLQALNSGTCFFIFWSSLACLNQFVNSIVWAGNALNPAPAWCEISIRIMLAASVGIPASSLCINRRLYYIASMQAASITPAEKRRAILIDTLICGIFPLFYVALQFVVQGHRFNIFEDIGCYPALYNTLLTFFLSNLPPLLLGLVSAVYCVLSLHWFSRRRAEFSRLLTSHTPLTISRYFRLMALAMTEICATTPLTIFTIWLNATANPIGPWRSWADTHFDYSRVDQIPAVLWRSNRVLAMGVEFTRWAAPVCSLIFFAYFGFAHESQKNYLFLWNAMKKVLCVTRIRPENKSKLPLTAIRKQDISSPQSVVLLDLERATSTTTVFSTTADEKHGHLSPLSPISDTLSGSLTLVLEPPTRFEPSSSSKELHLTRARTL